MSREQFIQTEIERAFEASDDDWKKQYFENAVKFLKKNRYLEGGHLCAFCREQGMPDPHHHNVWCSMVRVLNQYGWITKIGKIKPTCKHTHIHEVTEWESNLFR